MIQEIIDNFFGKTYSIPQYIVFIIFGIIGLLLYKNIKYKKKKEAHILAGNDPKWRFSFAKWLDENAMDAFLVLLVAFIGLRFFGYWINMINLPDSIDVMVFGFLIGLGLQKILHEVFQKVSITNTISKVLK